MPYESIDKGQSFRLRGTNQQSSVGLLLVPPSITQHAVGGSPQARTTAFLEGLEIGYASLHNRSGSSVVVGIGARLPNRLWGAGRWSEVSSTYTDDTADAQGTTAGSFALETANTANDDGYIIHSAVPFNAVSINVTTASSIGNRQLHYSNAAGTGWTQYGTSGSSNAFIFDGESAATYAIGENLLVFAPPADWGLTDASLATNLPAGRYAIRVRQSGIIATAGLAGGIEVLRLKLNTEALADNGTWEFAPPQGPLRFPDGAGLVALFGTANAGNRVTALARTA